MRENHDFSVTVEWTGNQGFGTSTYKSYTRDHEIGAEGKPIVPGSSDPAFRGDASRYNPEDLLIAALSACHMLSYLHLCAVNQVVVTTYRDSASGVLHLDPDGGGKLTSVTLRPKVSITPVSNPAMAMSLHNEAHRLCFIANSVNFPVHHEAEIVT